MGRAGPTPEHGMAVGRKLEGRRVAVLAADGFEKIELTVPVAALAQRARRSRSCRCGRAAFAA